VEATCSVMMLLPSVLLRLILVLCPVGCCSSSVQVFGTGEADGSSGISRSG
jgi:hypothetical protein